MNIITVDDERLVLLTLEETIREAVSGCALSTFVCPRQALAFAAQNSVEVAFLDIELNAVSGLIVAKQLKDINGRTNIVFVTGYPEYAPEAFALHASGYLRKPVSVADIRAELDNLRHPLRVVDSGVRIQCFGNFEIFVAGRPVHFRRSKAKEVLAYLVSRNGSAVSKRELAAVLWADAEYTRSVQSHIQTLIAEMRRALGQAGAGHILVKSWNSLALNTASVRCDFYDFIRGDAAAVNAYCGEFMANYPWAEFTAGWLDKKMHHL